MTIGVSLKYPSLPFLLLGPIVKIRSITMHFLAAQHLLVTGKGNDHLRAGLAKTGRFHSQSVFGRIPNFWMSICVDTSAATETIPTSI